MNSHKIVRISRRDFFKKSILLSAGGAGLILPLLAQSGRAETSSQACQAIVTPPLGEGPFYPIKNWEDKDNDPWSRDIASVQKARSFTYMDGLLISNADPFKMQWWKYGKLMTMGDTIISKLPIKEL
jgi:hypothetical protein